MRVDIRRLRPQRALRGGALSRQNLAECLEHEKIPVSRLTAGMDCGAG